MTELLSAGAIATELENHPEWKRHGRTATNIAAIALATTPFTGGIAVLMDKLAQRFLDPDVERKLVELANVVDALAGDIQELATLEEQVAALMVFMEKNRSVLDRLNQLSQMVNEGVPNEFHVLTDDALQEFIEVAVQDMDVRVEAHNGGRNYLYEFHTERGDAMFHSTSGGEQRVERSTFSGRHDGKVSMDKINIRGPIGTFDSPEGTGIRFGAGGSIGFGPGGAIGFGKRKKKQD